MWELKRLIQSILLFVIVMIIMRRIFLYCLYNKAVEQNADVVMCNSKLRLQNGSFRNNSYTNIFKIYNTKSDYIALSRTSLCYLLLRRNLFEDLPIPSLRNGEDMAIIPLLLAKAKIITHIDNALYVYCVRNGSASVSVSANSFWDLLKCQQLIEKSWNKEYQEALQFIGIKKCIVFCCGDWYKGKSKYESDKRYGS